MAITFPLAGLPAEAQGLKPKKAGAELPKAEPPQQEARPAEAKPSQADRYELADQAYGLICSDVLSGISCCTVGSYLNRLTAREKPKTEAEPSQPEAIAQAKPERREKCEQVRVGGKWLIDCR